MNVIEKHGAEWYWSVNDGELVVELYDAEVDVIGAVHKRSEGVFRGCLYGKIKDPGAEAPNWAAMQPEALFDNLEEARDHVLALIAEQTSDFRRD